MHFVIVSNYLNLNYQIPLIQLDLRHNLSETSLIRDNFNFPVVNFFLYVATFQQHLQMNYSSHSWNDVRVHEFCYPLSSLCHKWTLICLVCTDCRSFHLSSLDLSPCLTYNRLLASAAWWMPLLEQDIIYHLRHLCLTPILMMLLLLKI